MNKSGMPNKEIAEMFGVTPSRIRQIVKTPLMNTDVKEQIRKLAAELSTDDLIAVYEELVKIYGERVIPPDHNN